MDIIERQAKRNLRVAAHYNNQFGRPFKSAQFRTEQNAFEILAWTPEQTGEGVYLFATLGAQHVSGSAEIGCEFFFGLTSFPEGLPDALAEVALDGNGTGNVPASGDTITLAFNLWQGTEARTFMFTDGGEEIIPPLVDQEGRVDFVQLVPLFPNELKYKSSFGEDALWQLFDQNQVPFWEAERRPVAQI